MIVTFSLIVGYVEIYRVLLRGADVFCQESQAPWWSQESLIMCNVERTEEKKYLINKYVVCIICCCHSQ